MIYKINKNATVLYTPSLPLHTTPPLRMGNQKAHHTFSAVATTARADAGTSQMIICFQTMLFVIFALSLTSMGNAVVSVMVAINTGRISIHLTCILKTCVGNLCDWIRFLENWGDVGELERTDGELGNGNSEHCNALFKHKSQHSGKNYQTWIWLKLSNMDFC